MALHAYTNGNKRRTDFKIDEEEYKGHYSDLKALGFTQPVSAGVEGNIISAYYNFAPPQFTGEETDGVLFSLKIDKRDGSYSRKRYVLGNPTLYEQDKDIIITGIFLDEPEKYTLYEHPTETTDYIKALSTPEGTIGYTYENGVLVRETLYSYQ